MQRSGKMGATTPKTIFFHLPRTGGTWVEASLKRAFGGRYDKVCVDAGWDLEENGIHISPRKLAKVNKFSFTFVRHPLAWYKSFYDFLVKKDWDSFVKKTLGKYTRIVKEFEKVDFVGRTENLYFDLCEALDEAGEEYDEDKFLAEHVNRSISNGNLMTKEQEEKILSAEKYVVDKYYEGKKRP